MDNKTQDFVPIQDIANGMVIMKDNSVAMVIQTSAVNFDLLSENEQMAIIGSFAGLLNSLSFAIQILIRSKKLDISAYLERLVIAEQQQNNLLLKKLIQNYRNFVSSVIRENEVLDKQFFVVISITSLELGMINSSSNKELFLQKALTTLTPRRDHLIRQLGRIGLKATQLDDEKLVKLFYDWYNEPVFDSIEKRTADEAEEAAADEKAAAQAAQPKVQPTPAGPSTPVSTPQPAAITAPPLQAVPTPTEAVTLGTSNAGVMNTPAATATPTSTSVNPTPVYPATRATYNPYPQTFPAQQIHPAQVNQVPRPTNTPFVVEELHDDYGTA